jgi:hypothetical protein
VQLKLGGLLHLLLLLLLLLFPSRRRQQQVAVWLAAAVTAAAASAAAAAGAPAPGLHVLRSAPHVGLSLLLGLGLLLLQQHEGAQRLVVHPGLRHYRRRCCFHHRCRCCCCWTRRLLAGVGCYQTPLAAVGWALQHPLLLLLLSLASLLGCCTC